MKAQIIILALLCTLFSCTKDQSGYEPQQKEAVPPIDLFNPDGPDRPNDGSLRAGMNKVNMEVIMPDGEKVMRNFKYYFPISINPNKPISLVFNFHGSYLYNGTVPPDPILDVYPSHPLNKVADTANMIAVWPAGTAEPGAVNWQFTEKHIPFVKAMIEYFKKATPAIDVNRIYTCGHSSGANFSFALAKEMNDVFAAACPVSGQMRQVNPVFPNRTVPIRAFNGVLDATVNHTAALTNINSWADQMANYYAKDNVKGLSVITLSNYNITPYKWNGGNGDIEFYSIAEADHGVSWNTIMPLMWEFMRLHPFNKPVGLYLGVQVEAINFTPGQKYTIGYKSSRGVDVRVVSAPQGFTVALVNNNMEINASTTAVAGKIVLEGTLGTQTKTVEFTLNKK
ncbi:hypothetical protein [Pedobacter nyackensis]|uniref:alpha/beta hydrolase family esterase n=1 Tax=Pedobacter nyackensis TaxID=475255 RepID=UPI00292CEF22|nr:hypothetical protein [Pedobacter nyackensis]